MAYVLSKPPSREGDYTWFKHLKDYLRVWAVLLAHILEMPLGDPGKTFLAQALRAEYE